MIYAIENGQKIPLGTQFDNNWEIEYDRDLSSQLSGKTEWTATEDCWFQYATSVARKADEVLNNEGDINTTRVLLNGVKISTNSSSYTWNQTVPVRVFTFMASILMKKGDVISITRDGAASALTFSESDIHVFPIHRILSKDEGHFDLPHSYDADSKIVTIDVSQLFKGDAYTPYQITACIGSDADIYAFSIIAYKIWNGSVYYSTVINRVGTIQAVTATTITYKIGGSFANVTASAIKL